MELPVAESHARPLVAMYHDADAWLSAIAQELGQPGHHAERTIRWYNERARLVGAIRKAIDPNLNASVRAAANEAVGQAYMSGAFIAERALDVSGDFNGVHRQAVDILAGNVNRKLSEASVQVGRHFDDFFRGAGLEAAARQILTGVPTGEAAGMLAHVLQHGPNALVAADVSKMVEYADKLAGVEGVIGLPPFPRAYQARLRNAAGGVTGFVDKAGKRWQLGKYAEMVVRTTTREAVSHGTANRMLDAGYNVVTISAHANPCPLCAQYDGNTYYLTQPDLNTVGEDTASHPTLDIYPPFHPNCRHVLTPAAATFAQFEEAVGLDAMEPKPSISTGPLADQRAGQEAAARRVAFKREQRKLAAALPDDAPPRVALVKPGARVYERHGIEQNPGTFVRWQANPNEGAPPVAIVEWDQPHRIGSWVRDVAPDLGDDRAPVAYNKLRVGEPGAAAPKPDTFDPEAFGVLVREWDDGKLARNERVLASFAKADEAARAEGIPGPAALKGAAADRLAIVKAEREARAAQRLAERQAAANEGRRIGRPGGRAVEQHAVTPERIPVYREGDHVLVNPGHAVGMEDYRGVIVRARGSGNAEIPGNYDVRIISGLTDGSSPNMVVHGRNLLLERSATEMRVTNSAQASMGLGKPLNGAGEQALNGLKARITRERGIDVLADEHGDHILIHAIFPTETDGRLTPGGVDEALQAVIDYANAKGKAVGFSPDANVAKIIGLRGKGDMEKWLRGHGFVKHGVRNKVDGLTTSLVHPKPKAPSLRGYEPDIHAPSDPHLLVNVDRMTEHEASVPDIERRLLTADVDPDSFHEFDVSTGTTIRAQIGGEPALVKPVSGAMAGLRSQIEDGMDSAKDRASHLITRELGIPSPVSVQREVDLSGVVAPWGDYFSDHELCTVQEWATWGRQPSYQDHLGTGSPSARRTAMLDVIVGNLDRHGGNFFIDTRSGDVIPIDHNLTFPNVGRGLSGNDAILREMYEDGLTTEEVNVLGRMLTRWDTVIAPAMTRAGLPLDEVKLAKARLADLHHRKAFPRSIDQVKVHLS